MFKRFKSFLAARQAEGARILGAKYQGMAFATTVVGLVVGILVLGLLITNLWPIVTDTASANVSGLTGTDAGTTFIVSFWPVVLVMGGIAIGIGTVYWILKETNIL